MSKWNHHRSNIIQDAVEKWLVGLLKILWSIWMTPISSIGDTPFNLAFGTDVVISTEIGVHTLYVDSIHNLDNKELLCLNLNLLEEDKDETQIRAVTR